MGSDSSKLSAAEDGLVTPYGRNTIGVPYPLVHFGGFFNVQKGAPGQAQPGMIWVLFTFLVKFLH